MKVPKNLSKCIQLPYILYNSIIIQDLTLFILKDVNGWGWRGGVCVCGVNPVIFQKIKMKTGNNLTFFF